MTTYINIPLDGERIDFTNNKLHVPAHPIIPFIQGDGVGVDITPVMQQVVNAAVEKAYNQEHSIKWMEIYAGDKAVATYGAANYLPEETLSAIKEFHVAIKGPLATPVSGGFRSLNVSLRQKLDLYLCQRPVRWFSGVPSPVKHPEKIDMTIFRENTEDIYAGIEWAASSPGSQQVIDFLQQQMKVTNIRFDTDCGIGIKPVSKQGSQRLIKKAIEYAIEHDLNSVTLVHKGNIMKFTEGAFRDWGYQLAVAEFGAHPLDDNGVWHQIINPNTGKNIIIKDIIADAFLQNILLHPEDYDVVATLNLNGDYISDALAAQVGGIGIAPGANLSDTTAIFEATHGTAPKMAGNNSANPSSLILSATMLLQHLGWLEAASIVMTNLEKTIQNKTVTTDFYRTMTDATLVTTSQFGEKIIANMVK